jgi:hypothetical protein
MRRQPRTHSRPIDSLNCRVVIFFIFILCFLLKLDCRTAPHARGNPVPCGTRNHSSRGALNSGLTSADSGLQVDSGDRVKRRPGAGPASELKQRGRRCVETSDNVIELVRIKGRSGLSSLELKRGDKRLPPAELRFGAPSNRKSAI